ncbi:pentapeptide repeat-containing protein [Microbacterium sp. Marseille-Q6648]|uniref:pentapeptide repeat-containing protein n=1 Tax=Microbacterium sp. Marseille-Q6648 TaxID=2937991 RepID=UPI00203EA094|nr:pentapeptide repeat-containing protein [Microbacterium sp. Marseille-Q6648]
MGDVELIDVDLSRAKFGATDLGRCDLTRVRFAGRVANLTIGARRVEEGAGSWALSDVDFSGADPIGLHLVGVDYGTPAVDVRLPYDDRHWIIRVWRDFLTRVASNAPGDL